jgi:hypothetical protein
MTSPFHPMHLVLGLVLWSVWFVAMYGGLSVACVVAPPAEAAGALTWINGVLLLLTLFTTALLLYAAWRCWQAAGAADVDEKQARFVARVSAAVYLASAGAVLAVGLPVIVLPPCI